MRLLKKYTKNRKPFPFGTFLKRLRKCKGVSLKEVEKETGVISNAYLSQLETGARRHIPQPDKLKALADYYNVSIQELLKKAGYYEGDIKETKEQQIEKGFLRAIGDPGFKYGLRLKNKCDLDSMRFIAEIYKKHFEPEEEKEERYDIPQPNAEWICREYDKLSMLSQKKVRNYLKYLLYQQRRGDSELKVGQRKG